MGVFDLVLLALTRPGEFRSLVHYKIWRDPLNDIKLNPKESGWDRQQMRECWKFLDLTSRSFAAVIKELKGELSRVICLYYLILRALDTIEDDMTIPADKKIPLLTSFYKKLEVPGWNFTESGPNEKDRQLLVEFDKVIAEFQLLDENYRIVISDMTAKMGAGMASYIEASSSSDNSLCVVRWQDYDLYCHFVAGLVGEGLSRLFSASGMERPWLGEQLILSNHMGLFLQKTNIIRDYAEDCEQGRFFWPKECWAAPECGFASQAAVADGIEETSPGSNVYRAKAGELGQRSMNVLSAMLLDALSHATQSLDYLAVLREQSVFNFCAIPQVMAIATLELMFANPNVLKKNVKIRKSQAVQLILRATNPRDVAWTFRRYARSMHARLSPDDPYFVRWSVELSRIEVWCETLYPSYVSAPGGADSSSTAPAPNANDARTNAMRLFGQLQKQRAVSQARALRASGTGNDEASDRQLSMFARAALSAEEREKREQKDKDDLMRFFVLMMAGMTVVIAIIAIVVFEIAWYWQSSEQDPLSLLLTAQYHTIRAKGLHVFAHLAEWGSEIFGEGVSKTASKVEL
ncbi:putative farnesyl-diphosphate farnesyltransferase [Tilletiaria anomala UBC 951]|uniref:Squalene synthase n=1 Tax=Tilletiaria anomala (strain ATCC 24038 / CBS 436.72 / UBC 951) TaxID=1037660 RepID=A0A066WFT4_TILAU|nr:putative farnesyl-diphosphate farnesyltransferase [Tilletiaria anomala UBC 951]KDN51353.1 putative farnesyl-diphosphate farnesyltransferase [Tilletiaria anomala UBC 951]